MEASVIVNETTRHPSARQVARDALVAAAWRIYGETEHDAYVVRPSMPILYFGDSERYFGSPLKIVTVGLNPSRAEFPESDRYERFPRARAIYPQIMGGLLYEEYLRTLNDYFRVAPYSRWFRPSFEAMLNGLDASYYGASVNTALHTDLCTPLATDPTWSGLREDRTKLEPAGIALWHALLRYLEPDIALVSVAGAYLDHIQFPRLDAWRTIHTVERANPYQVRALPVTVTPGKTTYIIFGRAANQPFGTISADEKRRVGTSVKGQFDGR